MLSRSFKSRKCNTLLKLAISRIKTLRNKRENQLKQSKRDLAQLLQAGQEQAAKIRVEHVIREEKIMAAYEIIEVYCELIVARLPVIEAQRYCPIDLKEAIASVIFASPRCTDIHELQDVCKLFVKKYGKEFISSALELRPNCGVSSIVVEKLSAKVPDGEKKLKVLTEIAREHNVKWDVQASRQEILDSSDILVQSTHSHNTNSCTELNDDAWKGLPDSSSFHSASGDGGNIHLRSSQPNLKHSAPGNADGTKYSKHSSVGEDAATANDHNFSIRLKDAAAAAYAAAESAEKASLAARVAAELSTAAMGSFPESPNARSGLHSGKDIDNLHDQQNDSNDFSITRVQNLAREETEPTGIDEEKGRHARDPNMGTSRQTLHQIDTPGKDTSAIEFQEMDELSQRNLKKNFSSCHEYEKYQQNDFSLFHDSDRSHEIYPNSGSKKWNFENESAQSNIPDVCDNFSEQTSHNVNNAAMFDKSESESENHIFDSYLECNMSQPHPFYKFSEQHLNLQNVASGEHSSEFSEGFSRTIDSQSGRMLAATFDESEDAESDAEELGHGNFRNYSLPFHQRISSVSDASASPGVTGEISRRASKIETTNARVLFDDSESHFEDHDNIQTEKISSLPGVKREQSSSNDSERAEDLGGSSFDGRQTLNFGQLRGGLRNKHANGLPDLSSNLDRQETSRVLDEKDDLLSDSDRSFTSASEIEHTNPHSKADKQLHLRKQVSCFDSSSDDDEDEPKVTVHPRQYQAGFHSSQRIHSTKASSNLGASSRSGKEVLSEKGDSDFLSLDSSLQHDTLPSTEQAGAHLRTRSKIVGVSNRKVAAGREASVENARHVHPKLPDYDSLAAHFESLRTDRC